MAPPMARDPRSIATNPVLLINSITNCLASVSSPDVKMTVRGLFGEKSCIQSIGMLLIDFTSLAPTAISKEINVDDSTRYLSSILAGLSIQAANGSTKAELKRTSQIALRHLGY